ncbi:hypothetical protein M885DRAFT_549891 [Pelagophyceae sp. CCMP2097]|nr:hypothetical protein M885DRAFT_549891 [Pelagophyceae sp. CCMP2097]
MSSSEVTSQAGALPRRPARAGPANPRTERAEAPLRAARRHRRFRPAEQAASPADLVRRRNGLPQLLRDVIAQCSVFRQDRSVGTKQPEAFAAEVEAYACVALRAARRRCRDHLVGLPAGAFRLGDLRAVGRRSPEEAEADGERKSGARAKAHAGRGAEHLARSTGAGDELSLFEICQ